MTAEGWAVIITAFFAGLVPLAGVIITAILTHAKIQAADVKLEKIGIDTDGNMTAARREITELKILVNALVAGKMNPAMPPPPPPQPPPLPPSEPATVVFEPGTVMQVEVNQDEDNPVPVKPVSPTGGRQGEATKK